VFIRTSGCPLRCHYCDTTYAYFEGAKQTLDSILGTALSYPADYFCVTGGEPLAQPQVLDLMKALCEKGKKVSLETSGNYSCEKVDKRVKKIIDVKTPDSGAADTFLIENLNYATAHDEFKFVICSEKDFHWAENFVNTHSLCDKHTVLYSPSFGQVKERDLASWILKTGSKVRMQLQLHKYIWSPETRGV
jgi:7-carboxy-7-deazaguanine synthase